MALGSALETDVAQKMRLAFARSSCAHAETAVGDEGEPLLLTLEQLTLRTDTRVGWTRRMKLTSDLRSKVVEKADFRMVEASKCYVGDVVVERAVVAAVDDGDVAVGDVVGVGMTGVAVDGFLAEKKSMLTASEVTMRKNRLACRLELQMKQNLFGYQRMD